MKAQTRIELTMSNSEMIHLAEAMTAMQMWKQLCQVKELKGILEVLAAKRKLYQTYAEEEFSMVNHISGFRKIQEELALMGDSLSDNDFSTLLITSLSES
jgi:hypothetical protein